MLTSSITSRTPLLANFLCAGAKIIQEDTIQAIAYHQGAFIDQKRIRTAVNLFFPKKQQILSGYGVTFSTSPMNFVTFDDSERGRLFFQTALTPYELLASEVNALFAQWQRLHTDENQTGEQFYTARKRVSIDTAFFIASLGEVPL